MCCFPFALQADSSSQPALSPGLISSTSDKATKELTITFLLALGRRQTQLGTGHISPVVCGSRDCFSGASVRLHGQREITWVDSKKDNQDKWDFWEKWALTRFLPVIVLIGVVSLAVYENLSVSWIISFLSVPLLFLLPLNNLLLLNYKTAPHSKKQMMNTTNSQEMAK